MQMTTADVLARTADVIEPHITGNFKRRDRAEGNAKDLHDAGLLRGGRVYPGSGTVQEQAAANLQCIFNWPIAEQIADELAEAGLLRQER